MNSQRVNSDAGRLAAAQGARWNCARQLITPCCRTPLKLPASKDLLLLEPIGARAPARRCLQQMERAKSERDAGLAFVSEWQVCRQKALSSSAHPPKAAMKSRDLEPAPRWPGALWPGLQAKQGMLAGEDNSFKTAVAIHLVAWRSVSHQLDAWAQQACSLLCRSLATLHTLSQSQTFPQSNRILQSVFSAVAASIPLGAVELLLCMPFFLPHFLHACRTTQPEVIQAGMSQQAVTSSNSC